MPVLRTARFLWPLSGQYWRVHVNTYQHYPDERGLRRRTNRHESALNGPAHTNIADLQNQCAGESRWAGSIPVTSAMPFTCAKGYGSLGSPYHFRSPVSDHSGHSYVQVTAGRARAIAAAHSAEGVQAFGARTPADS